MTPYARHLRQLSEVLKEYEPYWRQSAFHQSTLSWMDKHPKLQQRLFTLPLADIDSLASDTRALHHFLAEDFPVVQQLAELTQLVSFSEYSLPAVSPRFYAGMPGRKWQQIQAFAACFDNPNTPLLEWCAGKSYLGFYLQQLTKQTVTALEWDKQLVEQANLRAKQQNIDLCSHCIDVLSQEVDAFLQQEQHVIALHACGELHEQLLQHCVERKVKRIHLAPCCYHKRKLNNYQPLSQHAKQHDIQLDKASLHIAVMETVTAGATLQRQRKQLQIMRLGFDYLQRDINDSAQFLDLPSLPAKWAKADFADFCRHCAALKKMPLPTHIDWTYYLNLGEQRFKQVSALDLVRFLFRRPLEIWLALDRALMLEEQGYTVELGIFCATHLTPRNIMLKARLLNRAE